MQHKSYTTQGSEETEAIATRIASQLRISDVLLLKGELGTGKSTFARALIQALCGKQTVVPSPTFTLVQTYETPLFTLWHFDLYRLKHVQEIFELGIEEAWGCGVSIIEWPERLGTYLPQDFLEIEFKYGIGDNERRLTFRGWEQRPL
jgi:tRNA threonylcarbamoyladenosine biosynthesis protein TsaE